MCDICAHRNKVFGWGKCFNVEVVLWRENWTGLFRGWSSLCSLDAQEAHNVWCKHVFWSEHWLTGRCVTFEGSHWVWKFTVREIYNHWIGDDDVYESSRGFTIRRKEHSNNWDSFSNFACSQGLGGLWSGRVGFWFVRRAGEESRERINVSD